MSLLEYVPGTAAWRGRRDAELCRKTIDHIQEIVDGEVTAGRAARDLEHHLEACERCGVEASVIRDLKQGIARVSGEADGEFVQRLEALAKRLCEETDAN